MQISLYQVVCNFQINTETCTQTHTIAYNSLIYLRTILGNGKLFTLLGEVVVGKVYTLPCQLGQQLHQLGWVTWQLLFSSERNVKVCVCVYVYVYLYALLKFI